MSKTMNPYHDAQGRFTTGGGGSTQGHYREATFSEISRAGGTGRAGFSKMPPTRIWVPGRKAAVAAGQKLRESRASIARSQPVLRQRIVHVVANNKVYTIRSQAIKTATGGIRHETVTLKTRTIPMHGKGR